jgi:hypothetical protein
MKRLATLFFAFCLLHFSIAIAQAATSNLPQTGQTSCWDASGIPIPCAGTGQDGELNAGLAWPNPRFAANADQTMTDTLTGLIWSKNGNPAGTGKTWQQALDYVKTLNSQNYLGHNDWRLPNIVELISLVNRQQSDQSVWLASQGFSAVQSYFYWSSSTCANGSGDAWYVSMGSGNMRHYYKTQNDFVVWPVRSGVSGSSILPKTGQTGCWDTSGATVSCAGSGQDGGIQAGAAWPTQRFTLNADKSVTDNLNGLMWSKDANLMATRDPAFDADTTASDGLVTWQHALDYIKVLNNEKYLGHNDWRLPNTMELGRLTNYQQANLALWLNMQGFSNVQTGGYWTSGTNANNLSNAWGGNLGYGDMSYDSKSAGNYGVWPVRNATGSVPTIAYCGAANDVAVPSIPASNLCAVGTASVVTGPGPWSWNCLVNGVSAATCRASIVSYSNNATPGSGGTTWQSIGPFGGTDLNAIAIDPTDRQTIYVSAFDGGFFKSINGGASWTSWISANSDKSLGRVKFYSISVDQISSQTIYAGTDGGLLKSDNRGGSWSLAQSGITDVSIHAVAVAPNNSKILYAGSETAGVFKSIDAGNSWTPVGSGIPIASYAMTIVIDPNNSQKVYVGTINNGLYLSTDGGGSWTGDGHVHTVNAIAIDPKNGQTIYAGSDSYGLVKSSDGGATWVQANMAGRVTSIIVDPSDSQTIYFGTTAGLFKSTNGGTSSILFNSSMSKTYIHSLAIDPTDSKTLYIGTNKGVLKTSNGGLSLADINSGMTGISLGALKIDPNNSQKMYAGTSGRLLMTTNGGASWIDANNSALIASRIDSIAIDPSDSQKVYAGMRLAGGVAGVIKSTDGGVSWVLANTGIADQSISAIAIDPTNGKTIYLGSEGGGVFKSTDGASSWTAINNGLPTNLTALSLVLDPANNQVLYLGTTVGIFKSTNVGASWSAASGGLTITNASTLAFDPNHSQTLYAASIGGGVFKTTNGGATWAALNNGLGSLYVSSVIIDPANTLTMYAGSDIGVFKTINAGTSWVLMSNEISGGQPDLAFDPTDSRVLYASTNFGIYTLRASNNVPLFTGSATATFTERTAALFTVATSGWPAPSFALTGSLPTGIIFDNSTGSFSGTPAAGTAGAYPVMISATNGIPPDALQRIVLTVVPASSPGIAITSPKTVASLPSLTAITGTASGTGLSKVELQVSDGYKYLQQNGSFGTTALWITASGTTAWSLNTGSVAWLEANKYNITARAVDSSGNPGNPVATTFAISAPSTKTGTGLAISLTPQSIRVGDSINITGTLGVAGQPITLIVTPPASVTVPNPTPIVLSVTTDLSGNFSTGTLSSFTQPGTYLVRARFEGSSTLVSSFASQALGVTPQSGYAIIVIGKAADDSLLDMHTASADAIYATLVNKRGFLPANIEYLKSTTSAAVTKQQLQDAISQMKAKYAAAPAPFYLFMIDHGSQNGFVLGDTTPSLTLAPAELAPWLNDFETGVSSDTLAAFPRFLIIGSCYSGGFVSQLSRPGRVIITSAGADEQSLAGFSIYNSTTSTTYSGGEYFIDNMINFLGRGDSFKDAVMESSSNVALRDPRKVDLGQHSGVYDTRAQHPLLDDNGDGSASYLPQGASDGALAANLTLGVGIKSLGEPADITAVTGTTILPATQTDSLPLWLRVNDSSRVAKAWMEIRTPITSVSSNGGTGQVTPHLITQPLYYDGFQWNSSYAFANAGTYNILYYTQDNQTGDISPAAHSTVYKQLANNAAPSSFSLSAPADQGSVSPVFPLTWQEVASSNGVTYTLVVATDQAFNSVVYTEEGIAQATTYLADGKLNNPAGNGYYCQNGDSYCYWKVKAIDGYGAITESNTRSFTVVATNGLPALLKGYVRDSATGTPISGAKVTAGSATVATLSNGFYLSSVFNATVNLSVSATGYQTKTLSNVSTPAGKVVSNDISLGASGSRKPGDCDGNGTVTIAEVQSAINMFLGLKAVQACVDLDSSGVVTISEVQKVINSFLGL